MASIRKRGNGYQITVSLGYDSVGKKISETSTFTPDSTMTELQQKKALDKYAYEFEQKVISGKYLDGEKMTLYDFIERWFIEYGEKQLEGHTLEQYKRVLYRLVIPHIGHFKIAKVTPMHITSFYNQLTEDGMRLDNKSGGYNPNSIQKFHIILSSVFSTAVSWTVIDTNPCNKATLPKNKKTSDDINYFTPEQTMIFIELLNDKYTWTCKAHERTDDTGKTYHVNEYKESKVIETQFKLFFYFALFCGMRKGEVLALQWKDIDFIDNKVNITKSVSYVNNEMIIKEPKTKNSIRIISIPDFMMNIVKQHYQEQSAKVYTLDDAWNNPHGYLFTQWNGKLMDFTTPYHKLKTLIRLHNAEVANNDSLSGEEKNDLVLPDISLHGLRHTSATLLIANNKDIVTVAHRLGHAKPSTTMNIYAHALKKKDEETNDTFEMIYNKTRA